MVIVGPLLSTICYHVDTGDLIVIKTPSNLHVVVSHASEIILQIKNQMDSSNHYQLLKPLFAISHSILSDPYQSAEFVTSHIALFFK